jgi:hypothetical protein
MHFESEGGVVPMLCPGCCTLDDIPDWTAKDLKVVVGCHRCGFSFPALPGEFKPMTLTAMRNHCCEGPDNGNWKAVGEAIIAQIGNLGDGQFGALLESAWQQPQDDGELRISSSRIGSYTAQCRRACVAGIAGVEVCARCRCRRSVGHMSKQPEFSACRGRWSFCSVTARLCPPCPHRKPTRLAYVFDFPPDRGVNQKHMRSRGTHSRQETGISGTLRASSGTAAQ